MEVLPLAGRHRALRGLVRERLPLMDDGEMVLRDVEALRRTAEGSHS
jgi:hypothetical protein